jgi:tRNA(adenine34) deaminase
VHRLSDLEAVRRALDLARTVTTPDDDVPVGAVVLDSEGRIIAQAVNEREASGDPTAHAEVLALRRAAETVGTWRLEGCTIAVTLEPCPMCAGAIQLARISRVVFGAWNDAYGAAGSAWDLLRDRRLAHRPEVIGGVMEAECGQLVREFFARHRG